MEWLNDSRLADIADDAGDEPTKAEAVLIAQELLRLRQLLDANGGLHRVVECARAIDRAENMPYVQIRAGMNQKGRMFYASDEAGRGIGVWHPSIAAAIFALSSTNPGATP